jgi:ATP-dependent DNA helicase RecG
VSRPVRHRLRISNRTIQNLLDIDVYRARDLLRDLRDRGILVKTSQQERGTAVEYGPGENFPQPRRSRRTADPTDETTQTLFDPPPPPDR